MSQRGKMKLKNLNKIYIIGPQGSGKSTLAKTLSKKLRIKHYDLDDIVWSKKYSVKRTYKTRQKKLNNLVNKKEWILEGIFGGWTEPAFQKADLVIMLNLDYWLLVKNLLKRSLIGRFRGYEKEKTNLKDTWKIIQHVKLYRTRDHVKSYKGHMSLIKKHKTRLIEIRNQKQLKEFLEKLK